MTDISRCLGSKTDLANHEWAMRFFERVRVAEDGPARIRTYVALTSAYLSWLNGRMGGHTPAIIAECMADAGIIAGQEERASPAFLITCLTLMCWVCIAIGGALGAALTWWHMR